ncbi:hypothetical protein FVEN_g9697 [Fusarium venenatum]|uniref:BZIP domain-containing protein n=1 Tax=Fusarium venenatum TaxID=56646 RepID=A0A2L2TXN2_9HYPO|nr:uncharacterized protein FVRRES_11004 [Fusarium venenatum]KAG8352204.1 hypothetical protein FVEN_g9697 [Fusarium venenatum]CEI70927.1 unnamed protein product [Fusarium venenatum]
MYSGTQNSTAEARRLKKRELDRKAQRLARERAKSRVAQLESMVNNLRQDHSNAQIATLMDELGKVTKERDNLLQVLDSLGSTIHRHLGDSTASEPRSDTKSNPLQHASPTQSTPGERVVPIITPRSTSETSSSTMLELSINPPQPNLFTYDGWNYTVSNEPHPTTMFFNNPIPPPMGNGFIPIQPLLPDIHTPPEVVDVIIPKASVLCPCSSPTSRGANFHDVKPNIWRAINEVLVKPTKLSAVDIAIEEYNAEDMPVRAILEGWDSVERAGKMTPTWRKLRKADELCFSNCANTERLAAMRICHLLIMYHGDPILERRATLPRWYWNRPSQALPHSYCIDFFVWPGFRERLIFCQHQYCANSFWELLQTNLKILWSDSFQDTFYHNAHTGKYHISPPFEQRIRDINAWTMSTDFFTHFPELSEDIPVYMGIPTSFVGLHSTTVVPSNRRRLQDDEESKHYK